MSPPSIRAFYGYFFLQCFDRIIIDDVLTAAFTIVNRNWHAPNTLTGNYPVTTIANHVEDTIMAPFRNPLYLIVDCIKSLLTVPIYRGEPLFCSTVDNRVFTTPAVSVLVTQARFMKQCIVVRQDFDYRHLCIVDFYASQWEFSIAITIVVHLFSVVTSFINKRYDRKFSFAFLVITHNDIKVIFTVCRSCMYATSTCFECYMVTTQYCSITFYEWMFELSQF